MRSLFLTGYEAAASYPNAPTTLKSEFAALREFFCQRVSELDIQVAI